MKFTPIFARLVLILTLAALFGSHWLAPTNVRAQSGGIVWGQPFNVSRTPDGTSTDPILVADPAGLVHLFWAEKTSQQPTNNPDTLMYSRWDGSNWSQPVDIFFSPEEHGNQIVQYPHAALDQNGVIHLVWMAQPNSPNYTLFYSSVPANKAINSTSWENPIALASDLTGINYGVDIQIDLDNHIHIVYARIPAGDNAQQLRTTSYIRSVDGGKNWSTPYHIYTIYDAQSGASNNRLIADERGNLYTTWSEWDQSGNGQAVFFSRSTDNGLTWDKPIILARRSGNEYERDWASLEILGPDHLVVFYEGGWRAYRNVMYSYDGGQTWTESVDAFPGLIGENGFVEFERDSNETLHIFFANRTREGNSLQTGEGLWHSTWVDAKYWNEPILSSPNINMLNPKAAIMNGNQVMVAWYTFADREIMVMAGKIVDAPFLPSQPWPAQTPTSEPSEPSEAASPTPEAIDPTETAAPVGTETPVRSEPSQPASPGFGVVAGVVAALLATLGIVVIYKRRTRP